MGAGIIHFLKASVIDVFHSLIKATLDEEPGQFLPISKGNCYRHGTIFLGYNHRSTLRGIQVSAKLFARHRCCHGLHEK